MSRPGLSPRVVRDGVIDPVAWDRAVYWRETVGCCPSCGGSMTGSTVPAMRATRNDYIATCGTCGHEIVAPGGRVLTGSATKSRRKK